MANSWWEIQILCEPDLEETIFWRLGNFGCRGTASEIKDNQCWIKAYLPQIQAELLDLSALSLQLRQDALSIELSPPQVQWHLIDEEDWSSSWKQYWKPQEIGDRFLINPAWLPIPENSDRLIIKLDPGVAFGTGAHATTQLCLESLEMRLGGGQTSFIGEQTANNDVVIADIGCGSGILSIGALLLGAKKVYAVDTDPITIKATNENRELNQIAPEKLVVEQGSIETVSNLVQEVDGIVCNILADVIMDLIPGMSKIVKPTTWAIFSGILLEQSNAVTNVLEQHGWKVATLWKRQEWCCLNVRRS